MCLNNLGEVARERRELAAARDYHRRALSLKESLAPQSLDAARSLNNLGLVAWQQGKRSEAEYLLSQTWELVRRQAATVTGDEARQRFGAATGMYAANLIQVQ